MTLREALRSITFLQLDERTQEAIDTIRAAAIMRLPQRPLEVISDDDEDTEIVEIYFCCPNCKLYLTDKVHKNFPNYCPDCGQKIKYIEVGEDE